MTTIDSINQYLNSIRVGVKMVRTLVSPENVNTEETLKEVLSELKIVDSRLWDIQDILVAK